MSLSGEQRRRAVQIARDKNLACPDCGSSEPVPEDEARVHPSGAADIAMRCEECESASEATLVLSPEEAKALGLHALRDRPETP
jgi:hypothetical protein